MILLSLPQPLGLHSSVDSRIRRQFYNHTPRAADSYRCVPQCEKAESTTIPPRLFCFGIGYTGRAICATLHRKGWWGALSPTTAAFAHCEPWQLGTLLELELQSRSCERQAVCHRRLPLSHCILFFKCQRSFGITFRRNTKSVLIHSLITALRDLSGTSRQPPHLTSDAQKMTVKTYDFDPTRSGSGLRYCQRTKS